MLADILKYLFIILNAVGCSSDVWMSGNAHDPGALFPFSVERVKVILSPVE
jgi:hypothetical protein